ncbi:hypothetical protein BDV19DRAFT_328062 [Aspergillus venezuelensis]
MTFFSTYHSIPRLDDTAAFLSTCFFRFAVYLIIAAIVHTAQNVNNDGVFCPDDWVVIILLERL